MSVNVANVMEMLGVGNVLDESGAWLHLSPLGDFPHERGTQRMDRKAVEALVNGFERNRATMGARFGGLPVYIGHPDVPSLSKEFSDSKAYGWIMELEGRADGIYGRVKWGAAGQELVANEHFKWVSPFWLAKDGNENGKRVLRPVELVSVGLTNKPNLPVNSLANEAVAMGEAGRRGRLETIMREYQRQGLGYDAAWNRAQWEHRELFAAMAEPER